MDSRERFTDTAETYARHRPEFPDEVVELCAEYAGLKPGSIVLDLGCGTGISSRMFARHGFQVIGIEPNAAMLAKAIEAGGGPEYRNGEAAATGMPDAVADLIVSARAMHWFDMDAALPEWRRVLRGHGACAAFGFGPSDSGWHVDYKAMIRRRFPELLRSGKMIDPYAWVTGSPQCADVVEHVRDVPQHVGWEALIGRLWSESNMVVCAPDSVDFNACVRELFERHARNGVLSYHYRMRLMLWRLV
jgi:ubiquinone/menaquinone biosynthesis C-methylase UbiE